MKKGIHPDYREIEAICSCGTLIKVYSTLKKNIMLDVCYVCHPFYTGKQRTVDVRGRIHRFNKRFNVSFNYDGKDNLK